MIRGWRGKRLAFLSIIGFCCVIFTYLGVNLILSGLHSYAQS
jgi:ABC-type transport system involved in cytochrome c biogenesis permease subunit